MGRWAPHTGMTTVLTRTDEFLRGSGLFAPSVRTDRSWWWFLVMIVGFTPIYGGMMGSFQFDSAERIWQVVYSAMKVPMLLFATTLLCLPAFFVLNTILGLREDLRDSLRAILGSQAGLSIALAALSPMTRFWYFSTSDYRAALLFNASAFALATVAGHVVMFRYYLSLMRRHGYHRLMWGAWLVLYAFVGIQVGWLLRPFVGSPGMPVTFFRAEPFSNAYVVVARLVFG